MEQVTEDDSSVEKGQQSRGSYLSFMDQELKYRLRREVETESVDEIIGTCRQQL